MITDDFLDVVYLLIAINLLIAIAWGMKKLFPSLPNSVPRKFLHVTAISVAAASFILVENRDYLFVLGALILIGNYLMVKKEIFEAKVPGKKNYGIFLVPVTYLILVATMDDSRHIAAIAMLVMAFADGFAAIVGENFPVIPYKLGGSKKTISGSITFWLFSFGLFFFAIDFIPAAKWFDVKFAFYEKAVFAAYFSFLLTFVEALSRKGLDNLLIPVLSAFLLFVFFKSKVVFEPEQLLLALLFVALIVFISFKARFLSGDGIIAAAVVGLVIFGLGGIKWAAPLIVFFFSSSALSKLKKVTRGTFEKGSRRDAFQVFANGFVPVVLMLFSFIGEKNLFYLLYLTALATATADTWATELGNISFQKTVSILNFKKEVDQGFSGGVSFYGTLASLLGALLILFSGIYWIDEQAWDKTLFVVAFGFFGMAVDSLLGALLQRKNICEVCGKITERQVHCGKPTNYYYGVKWMNNDAVNFLSISISVFVFYVIYSLVLI